MSVTFFVSVDGKEYLPNGFTYLYDNDPMYGRVRTNDNPLSMNVANGNCYKLMQLINMDEDFDYYGEWDDESLIEVRDKTMFVLHSLKSMPELDGGTETITSGGDGKHCLMVECGLREGYFTERLTTLLEIINTAITVKGKVVWG